MQGNGLFTVLIIGAVLLFIIFRRARSLLTRQKIRPTALTGRLALFAILGAVILLVTLTNVPSLLGDLVGLALGAGVAWAGLRLTVFDRQPDGLYYTPNKYIGLGVFALFLIRFVYKLATGLQTAGTLATTPRAGAVNPLAQFTSDPLTTAAYFILIGYYVVYYGLLILRYRQVTVTA